jgi:hypothetical protein
MAYQQLSGTGLWINDPGRHLFLPPSFVSTAIAATGSKYAMVGPVWWPSRSGTKDISRMAFRFGTVTKTGGSGLTVSLQDVSTVTAGLIPDETQDQTVAIANGDAAFASNTWIRTGTLSANRTVVFGELLAVAIEFDGAGRLGADSINFSGLNFPNSNMSLLQSNCLQKVSGTWTNRETLPDLVLEFSDGTFGSLDGSYPISAVNTTAFNSGNTPDEYALEFNLPFAAKVDAGYWRLTAANTSADFEMVLYQGTSALTTVAVDATQLGYGTPVNRPLERLFASEISLAAGTLYRWAIRPTTTNNLTINHFDVADANHFSVHLGGTSLVLNSRTDQGAWGAATTTRRPFAGLRISSLDDGAGGGGGGLIYPRAMNGGYSS